MSSLFLNCTTPKTNLVSLERGLGDQLAAWKGKTIILRRDTASFQGRTVDAIRVEVPDAD